MKIEYFFTNFDGFSKRISMEEALELVPETKIEVAVDNYKCGRLSTEYRVKDGILSICISE